jgi:hypothetical protein
MEKQKSNPVVKKDIAPVQLPKEKIHAPVLKAEKDAAKNHVQTRPFSSPD